MAPPGCYKVYDFHNGFQLALWPPNGPRDYRAPKHIHVCVLTCAISFFQGSEDPQRMGSERPLVAIVEAKNFLGKELIPAAVICLPHGRHKQHGSACHG
jgi:hypothetical protein